MTELGQHRIFPDFKRQRARMVKLLEEQGIADEAVLAAMRTVRRHLFVPEALQGRAYEDHALPIGFGQTISQPYIVAFMSQLLEAKPGMKVLEIGTGSGYQAAVLREMGLEVFTIERVRELYEAVRELFPEFAFRAPGPDGRWHIDIASGTDQLRRGEMSAEEICRAWAREAEAFRPTLEKYALY